MSEYAIPQIQRLLPRHFAMMEMLLAGHTNQTVADTLGISTQCVYVVTRSPVFQAEYQRRLEIMTTESAVALTLDREATMSKARAMLESASTVAATKQVQLLESEDESIVLRASGSILDRVFGKQDSVASPVVTVQISAPDAQLINLALKESLDVKRTNKPTNGTAAKTPQDQHRDVYQASDEQISTRSGQAEDQDQVEPEGKMVLSSAPQHLNGSH